MIRSCGTKTESATKLGQPQALESVLGIVDSIYAKRRKERSYTAWCNLKAKSAAKEKGARRKESYRGVFMQHVSNVRKLYPQA
jgi:hypothetical protein